MNRRGRIGFVAAAFSILSLQSAFAQFVKSDDGTRSILLSRYQSLLRQPDGVQKVSEVLGDFSIDETFSERWGESNLASLKRFSTVVVRAVLIQPKSLLTADGDSVETVYRLDVRKVLSGDAPGTLEFKCAGGRFTFPNGHTVTVHAAAFDKLKTGEEYFLFLRVEDGKLTLVRDMDGIFRVAPESGTVHMLDTDMKHNPEMRYLEGARFAILEQEIRNARR
jgi:hypothetical protein